MRSVFGPCRTRAVRSVRVWVPNVEALLKSVHRSAESRDLWNASQIAVYRSGSRQNESAACAQDAWRLEDSFTAAIDGSRLLTPPSVTHVRSGPVGATNWNLEFQRSAIPRLNELRSGRSRSTAVNFLSLLSKLPPPSARPPPTPN